jgi:hypothetical protein
LWVNWKLDNIKIEIWHLWNHIFELGMLQKNSFHLENWIHIEKKNLNVVPVQRLDLWMSLFSLKLNCYHHLYFLDAMFFASLINILFLNCDQSLGRRLSLLDHCNYFFSMLLSFHILLALILCPMGNLPVNLSFAIFNRFYLWIYLKDFSFIKAIFFHIRKL